MKVITKILSLSLICLTWLPSYAAEGVNSQKSGQESSTIKNTIKADEKPGEPFDTPFGLLEVYKLAQLHDPLFQRAGFEKLAVEERRNQALAELLPKLVGSADYTHTYQDIKSSDSSVVAAGNIDYGSSTFGLTLTQPVFHWDSIVGLTQSKNEIQLAGTRYLLAEHELIIRVADLYFRALSAQDQLAFAMAEQAAVEKHFELASGRYDMGLIPITDLHDAKARRAAILAKRIEAQNLLDDALQSLEEVAGEPVANVKSLRDEIALVSPDPDGIDIWVEKALEQNPAIQLQEHTVEIANVEVDRQHAGHYPTVDLVGRYEWKDTDGSLYGGGTDGQIADVLMVLNVPFYAGGAVSSRVREARHMLSSARQELVKQRRAVVRQARSAYLGVNSAINMVEALNQSVVLNQLALEAKQDGFMSGLYTSLNVLDAERDLSLASIDCSQARYDYLLNNLRLKQAVGSLTVNDLKLLGQWLQ